MSTALVRAIVALGSNLGDRAGTLRAALTELGGLGRLVSASHLYETAPVGPPQPAYLNAIALVDTTRSPRALLEGLLAIERGHGRERRERWGPRTLDLDLVAYGEQVVEEPGLHVPHPEAPRRAFVLVPLCEVASAWRFPDGRTASELRDALPAAELAGVRVFAP